MCEFTVPGKQFIRFNEPFRFSHVVNRRRSLLLITVVSLYVAYCTICVTCSDAYGSKRLLFSQFYPLEPSDL